MAKTQLQIRAEFNERVKEIAHEMHEAVLARENGTLEDVNAFLESKKVLLKQLEAQKQFELGLALAAPATMSAEELNIFNQRMAAFDAQRSPIETLKQRIRSIKDDLNNLTVLKHKYANDLKEDLWFPIYDALNRKKEKYEQHLIRLSEKDLNSP